MAHMAENMSDTFSQENTRLDNEIIFSQLGIVKITQQELSDRTSYCLFLHTISDFERISENAVNISGLQQNNEKLRFSDCAVEDVELMSF